jgi:hypothetical protein
MDQKEVQAIKQEPNISFLCGKKRMNVSELLRTDLKNAECPNFSETAYDPQGKKERDQPMQRWKEQFDQPWDGNRLKDSILEVDDDRNEETVEEKGKEEEKENG